MRRISRVTKEMSVSFGVYGRCVRSLSVMAFPMRRKAIVLRVKNRIEPLRGVGGDFWAP